MLVIIIKLLCLRQVLNLMVAYIHCRLIFMLPYTFFIIMDNNIILEFLIKAYQLQIHGPQ